jgi:uncharacterized protein DUF6301
MTERRVLPDQEITDLVTKLRSLKWAWSPDEVERVVADLGWTIMGKARKDFVLETEFGMGTGSVEVDPSDRVDRITTTVSTPVDADTAEERAFTQDAFARVVAATTQALGEPTQRVPGEYPEVRWRGTESTITVKRVSTEVMLYLATNEWVDEFDWA